jgi:NAD(P)H dehydrogenase (quinone)
MNISIILAHPNKGSFNHAIAETAMESLRGAGDCVTFHDLYEEQFAPVLQGTEIPLEAPLDSVLESHCQEIATADGIIIVHPNWWGMPPAILKGWIDRVLRPGIAYRFVEGDQGEGVPIGLLEAQAAIVFNTSNTPAVREQKAFGDPLERLWRDCIFDLCGVKQFHRRMFGVVVTSSLQERQAWLGEVQRIVTACFPAAQPRSGSI